MANHILLNNVDHQDLRINTARSAALGDNVMSCIAYHGEFRNLQAHFPIVFASDNQAGATNAMALMGLERGENLFLSSAGWEVPYVPMAMEMQPFLIGYSVSGGGQPQTVIHIDMESPRVGSEGEPVFLPMGGNTPYLEHVIGYLNQMHQGHEGSADFVAALEKYDLLEPFALDMQLVDGSSGRLSGYLTINEEKLSELGADALADLNGTGYLQAIYMVIASLSKLPELIHRKNARIAAGQASVA
jgi:hypothetical protein